MTKRGNTRSDRTTSVVNRKKRRFSYEERYVVWKCNGSRCWRCMEPLRLFETTVDHVLPELLLYDHEARMHTFQEYGLVAEFNINSYANWLPCHDHCNRRKGTAIPAFIPAHQAILEKLIRQVPQAERLEASLRANIEKDKVFSTLFAALERRKISMIDVEDLLNSFVTRPDEAGVPSDTVILDSGYWFRRAEFAAEGLCRCERNACVGSDLKLYCYFPKDLPTWIVQAGLFKKCYDEGITCPRCTKEHKRGHVGREGICENPYLDQVLQCD